MPSVTAARFDSNGPALALDVGGTKLAAALVAADGTILASDRTPTPAGPGIDGSVIWAAVTELLDRLYAAAGSPAIAGVGVGCGGPMVWPAGEVSPLNIPAWRGFPLRAHLAARYPGIPVRLHNDAKCMVIAEHWLGAGVGHQSLLGIVVSTGVGGGVILGGRVFDGISGNAGHVGHIVVEPDGVPCGCGGRGCLEAVSRGPAIAEWATERGWVPSRGDLGATAEALTIDARAGDQVALEALRRAGTGLGIGIASALATLDVELVVLGGGVSQAGALLYGPMHEALRHYASLGFTRSVPVAAAAFGPQAGVIGAAALVHQGAAYWSAD
ncbi:MAG: ROK family protein [Actinobacteria bacterium]|nr:ROK family protein [Actinomycetota bacterium]